MHVMGLGLPGLPVYTTAFSALSPKAVALARVQAERRNVLRCMARGALLEASPTSPLQPGEGGGNKPLDLVRLGVAFSGSRQVVSVHRGAW